MAGSTGLEPATLWIDSRGQPTAAPKRLVVSGQIKLREIDGHAPRRSTTRRNREGIRERHEPGYVRRGDSQSEAQLQDPAERDRTFLLGPSQPLRHPFHGWPDRFGFLDSTQAMFNPQGGPGDDLCAPPAPRYPVCISLVTAHTLTGDVPVQPALARPPQPITAPLALEPSDVAAVGHDFAPDSFVFGVVRKGASLVSREGDFGFSKENGQSDPRSVLHSSPENCNPATNPACKVNGPLVQIPQTGVIWRISRDTTQGGQGDDN